MNGTSKIAFVICLLFAPIASGAVIDMGNHILLPNTPGQVVPIYAGGGESVQGMDLCLSIEPTAGLWPRITHVTNRGPELLFGSSAYSNFGITADGSMASAEAAVTESVGELALSDSLPLLYLTLDTTGIFAGPVDKTYKLSPSAMGFNSMFVWKVGSFELYPVLIDGTLTIPSVAQLQVPEPSTLALATIAIVVGATVRRRRQLRSSVVC